MGGSVVRAFRINARVIHSMEIMISRNSDQSVRGCPTMPGGPLLQRLPRNLLADGARTATQCSTNKPGESGRSL